MISLQPPSSLVAAMIFRSMTGVKNMVKRALILALVALAIPAPAAASKITIVTASDAGGDDPAMENPYASSMEQALTHISNGQPAKAIEIYDLVIAAYEKDYPAGMAFCGDTSADALEAAASAPLVEQDIDVFALGPAW